MGFGSSASATPPPIENKTVVEPPRPDPVKAVDNKRDRNAKTRARAKTSSTLLGSEDSSTQLLGK